MTVTLQTCITPVGRKHHIQREIASHRSKQNPPGKSLVPEGGTLLQAEQNPANRSTKSGGNTCRRTATHKVTLFVVLSEKWKCFGVHLKIKY